ncbi:MAG: hypothetical protein H6825_09700 [Planctomycetes bacterium]|nr:hypothetical protein [Planctomycetota bacterium]
MKPQRLSLLAAGVGLLALPAAAQLSPWQVDSGRVAIHFYDDILEDTGLIIEELHTTAEVFDPATEAMDGDLVGFQVMDPPSDLIVLRNREDNFQPYGVVGGKLVVDGGFYLYAADTGLGVDFTGFEVSPIEVRNDGPGGEADPDYFFLREPGSPTDDFKLCYVKIFFSDQPGYEPPVAPDTGDHEQTPEQLRIKAWDLIVTPDLAAKLGRPDLANRVVGYGKIDLDMSEYGGRYELPEGQNVYTPYEHGAPGTFEGSVKDVKLGLLTSLSNLGHTGTFGSGRTGMSMSTTSCNVGDLDVPWLAAMQENHPGIAMGLYRQLGGRFEQVGVSWIKHGFFALSNSQCTTCQHPSNGTFLGLGCSDTYGTGNNGDRMWLGPRSEWNPSTAKWTCLGSYFDGTPADCVRSVTGSGNGPVNHRLEAFDVDLANPGATYYYEADYLVREDASNMNNIGSRMATITSTGSTFSMSTPGTNNPLIEGPALLRWGDMHTFGSIDGDGEILLAAQVDDLGNGTWHYKYGLFNWRADRRPGSFSVPQAGPTADYYFHDIDDLPTNDWVPTTAGKNVTFTFPGVFEAGHKVAGPLEFDTLYNFEFTSTHPPAVRDAVVGIHDAGQGGDLLGLETLAPSILTMGASKLSPAAGESIALEVKGGTAGAMIALLEVNGVPLPSAIIVTPTPIPFVGGEVSIPITVDASAAGASFTWIAADVGTSVISLSNVSTLAVQ